MVYPYDIISAAMFNLLRNRLPPYPSQFWLMFFGMLISSIGSSMIWPFLMIYISKKLDVQMTAAASLLTISAATGFVSSAIGGPFLDRMGRKGIMVFSLITNGLAYIFLGFATEYWHFAVMQAISGAVNPLYRAAADTMMADLIEPKHRTEAYSLMRMSHNLGIAIGPVIGGSLIGATYTLAFFGAAIGLGSYGLLIAFLGQETIPHLPQKQTPVELLIDQLKAYWQIFHDGRFMRMIFAFALVTMAAVLIWTIMPVHANSLYGISESSYRWIPITNALMVVFLQMWITSATKRFHPLVRMALGSLFYAFAVGSVSLARDLSGFLLVMVVMTIGELILVPTSSTYTANLAPADKRGRYMGLFGLTWPVAAGIGPIFGGILNDTSGPQSTWIGGMVIGLLGAGFFLMMHLRERTREQLAIS